MKTFSLFTTAIFLLAPLYFYAQPESFNVFYVKGTALLLEKNNKVILKKDMSINSNDKLITDEQTLVVLFNKKGLLALIDKKGTYSYDQLSGISNKQAGNSLLYDYFRYVLTKFLDSEIEGTQATTVVRGDTVPMVFPPDSAWFFDNKIEFSWKNSGSGNYFVIKDDNDEVLKLYTSSGTLTLFPFSSGIIKGKWYKWIVTDNNVTNGNSSYNNFYIPDENIVKDFKKKELQILSYLPDRKNEEYYTCLIALYIKYHDFTNAYEQMREAKGHKLNSPAMQKLYLAVDKLYGMK
jgi:hypothetical protein